MGWIYSKPMGNRLNSIMSNRILPGMKPYMKEEEYRYYKKIVETNESGLEGFDKHIYPKMFGYIDADDYYKKESLMPNIGKIKVPTFAIHSEDDQFIPVNAVPYNVIE